MADELQNQQGQSSSGAYGATGAVLGAAVGGVGAHYLTRPKSKYTSHEDIINEAKDSADFSSKLEKAEGEEKDFLKAAKDVADEKGRAEKAWDDGLEAFKKNNTQGVQDSDEIKDLVKKQEEYRKTVADLEAKQPAADPVSKTVKKDPIGLIRQNTKKLNEASEELKALKASGAPKESIDAVKQRIGKYQQRIDNLYKTILDNVEFKGTEEEIKAAKAALKAELQGYAQEYMAAYDNFASVAPGHNCVVAKQNIAKEKQAMEEALKAIKEASAYDLTSVAGDKNVFFRRADAIIKGEESRLKALEKMLENYNKASNTSTTTTFFDRLNWLINGRNLPEGDDKKAIQKFINGLSDDQKKLLKGQEVTKESLEELINASKEKIKTLRTSAATVVRARGSINALGVTLADSEKAIVKKYGKGAYVDAEGNVCKGTKVIAKAPEIVIPEFELKSKVELPKEIEINITTRGKTPEVPKELTEARANLTNVTKEIETKRAALTPKPLSADEQLAKYVAEKGKKEDFVAKQVKEKSDKFAKEFEAWFKRRHGFAENSNWKIAGVAAAGALVIGGLASLLAPSKKS